MLAAAGDPASGAAALTDPQLWVNVGSLGVIFWLFVRGILYSKSSVDEMRESYKLLLDASQRREDQLRAERDRALAERDEMIGVITDFNHMAAGMLQVIQGVQSTHRAPQVPRTPRRGEQR